MENALKNLGQFLSMTKLSGSVYPVVYCWPGSKNVGYFYATEKATSEINEQNIKAEPAGSFHGNHLMWLDIPHLVKKEKDSD